MKRAMMFFGVISSMAAVAIGQVNLPEGFEIVEFAESDKLTQPPRINNCGEIVYVQDRFEDSRVYLYDNGKITRLTDDDGGRVVLRSDINDTGTVVWGCGFFNQPLTWQVVKLEAGKRNAVGPGQGPRINNHGAMCWELFRQYTCHAERDIAYYDGELIREITNDRFNNQECVINDDAWIGWGQGDFCVNPWLGEIILYREGSPAIVPSEGTQVQVPTMNNRGQIAWGGEAGIELWQGGRTEVLTDDGAVPRLNNLGDMYFLRFDGPGGTLWDGYLYRVSGGIPTFHRLTEDGIWNIDGDINDWVEVAWRWRVGPEDQHGGIRFMRRIRNGDSEFDGDVDLDDHAALVACMTGPGHAEGLCDCRFLDVDHDGDIDLVDFSWFQNLFGSE